MKKIGLTGNIASGKSTASRCLVTLGAKIIDADVIAREIVQPGEPAWQQLQEAFGKEYFHPDGDLDRKKLGALVFNDANAKSLLDSITHKVIGQRIKAEMALTSPDAKAIVIDAALLIEAGMVDLVDEVWLVIADDEVRLERLLKRDGCSTDVAWSRIRSQMSQEEKVKYAQVVLDNSGTEEEFLDKVTAAFRRFLEG